MNGASRRRVVVYTDGACMNNPGPGGWGAVLLHDEHCREIAGGDPRTTNNRMELTAAIKALETLNQPCEVEIFTDSMYLKKGITEWLPGWKRRNWRTAGRKPVKNADLWTALERAQQDHQVCWHWIRGHTGEYYNEWADRLASAEIKRFL